MNNTTIPLNQTSLTLICVVADAQTATSRNVCDDYTDEKVDVRPAVMAWSKQADVWTPGPGGINLKGNPK